MIPILINNRDLLDSPLEQIKFFRRYIDDDKYKPYIIIIDNLSTFPYLLDYYQTCCFNGNLDETWTFGSRIRIPSADHLPDELFLLPENVGPRAASSIVPRIMGEFEYYFLSDADMDYSDLDPNTLLPDLIYALQTWPHIHGASASIRINDIPETNMTRLIREYEEQNWKTHPLGQNGTPIEQEKDGLPVDPITDNLDWWNGACDTAGVLRRVSPHWTGGYEGVRSARHIARHRPWYFSRTPGDGGIDTPDDFKWFYEHASPQGTAYTSFILDRTRNV